MFSIGVVALAGVGDAELGEEAALVVREGRLEEVLGRVDDVLVLGVDATAPAPLMTSSS
jgi:hypothetical protein